MWTDAVAPVGWSRGVAEARSADPDEAARILYDRQHDVVVAVARVVRAYDAGEIDGETAAGRIAAIRDAVLADHDATGATARLLDDVTTALVPVLHGAEEYVTVGPATGATVEQYVGAAADGAAADPTTALAHAVDAATRVAAGDDLDGVEPQGIDPDVARRWATGLERFAEALDEVSP